MEGVRAGAGVVIVGFAVSDDALDEGEVLVLFVDHGGGRPLRRLVPLLPLLPLLCCPHRLPTDVPASQPCSAIGVLSRPKFCPQFGRERVQPNDMQRVSDGFVQLGDKQRVGLDLDAVDEFGEGGSDHGWGEGPAGFTAGRQEGDESVNLASTWRQHGSPSQR